MTNFETWIIISIVALGAILVWQLVLIHTLVRQTDGLLSSFIALTKKDSEMTGWIAGRKVGQDETAIATRGTKYNP